MICCDDHEGIYLPSVISDGLSTLHELDLGIEKKLAVDFIAGKEFENTERLSSRIMSAFSENPQRSGYLPNVHHLRLRGLDLSCMMDYKGQNIVNFGHLTKMTLESCYRLETALAKLEPLQLPSLQHLQIRHEAVDPGVCNTLVSFLRSLPPLRGLYLLLQGSIPSFHLEQILEVHGESLRALLVDFRRGTRPSIHESRTLWKAQYLDNIAKFCPNLVELGIPVIWQPRSVRLSHPLPVSKHQCNHNQCLHVLTDLTVGGRLKSKLPQAPKPQYPRNANCD